MLHAAHATSVVPTKMAKQITKRIFSGIQPSGTAQLGNYLGAIRRWVQLQDECSSVLYSIVDLHSLTVDQAPLLLRQNIRQMAVCLLACGVDPDRTILFQQSQVMHGHVSVLHPVNIDTLCSMLAVFGTVAGSDLTFNIL